MAVWSTSTCSQYRIRTFVVHLSWIDGNSLLTNSHIIRERPQALVPVVVALPWDFADSRLQSDIFILDGGDG